MVTRCASAIKIVRPFESRAETQPQLHPALLRLSAMISQCFTVPLLTIQHCLRHGFAQFKLCAHFLNLIGLLLEARGQGLNLLFLQSDHCRLSFSCGLQFLHNALLFEQLVCRQRRLRGGNAKLAVCSYDNRDTGDCYTRDVADKASVAHVRTVDVRADTDDVISRGNAVSRAKAQSRVGVSGGVARERCNTVGRVVVAGAVEKERSLTVSRVGYAGGVAKERGSTGGRVVAAGGVNAERFVTSG